MVFSSLESSNSLLAATQVIVLDGGDQIIDVHQIELGAGRVRVLPENAIGEQEFEMDGSSATLKTDPELESTLGKAERYRDDGNYAFACKLWQLVLENSCLLYTSPSPRDRQKSRMPSSA